MSQSIINIEIDEELKKNLDIVCEELGMDITTAFTIFAKKMCREKRIPFDISIDPFYSASNMDDIEESIKELREGKIVVKTIEELEAMENETII